MKYILVIIVFLSLSRMGLYAQEKGFRLVENSNLLLHKLDSLSKSVNSIRSDFTQTKHISVLEEEIVSKGKFLFLKPTNIKWSYLAPINYEISIIGGKFKIKNDGKVSEYDAQSNKTFREINGMIISMMNGSILSNDNFEVQLFESKGFYKAELKPLDRDFKRFIAEIHIYFDKKDFMVSKLIMLEASGDFTLIKFQNRLINTKLALSELEFDN